MGGVILLVHPRYLLGALTPNQFASYKDLNRKRALSSYKAMSAMMTENSLVKIKEAPPYAKDLEGRVLLNSMARAQRDQKTGGWVFPQNLKTNAPMDLANAKAVAESLGSTGNAAGVGVDHGM